MSILVIEDDAQVRSLIGRLLLRDGHEVSAVGSAAEARAAIKAKAPHLVLLDRGLPCGDGLELGRWIRSNHPRIGIIIVTGRIEVDDRIAGLDSGADDYITKPFDTDELLARVRSLLRRLQSMPPIPEKPPVLRQIGEWAIDTDMAALVSAKGNIKLTLMELRLLVALVERPNRSVTRDWLLDRLEVGEDTGERVIDYHVHTLRAKLRTCGLGGEVITSVRGIGYAFVPPASSDASEF